MLPHQFDTTKHFLLNSLQMSKNTLVVCTNKNMGPALMDCTTYIQKALADHLLDATTYQNLSPTKAAAVINEFADQLGSFWALHHDELGVPTCKFLTNSLMEVTDQTRPIILVSGSLLHALGC
jgi:hypothetical protein